MRCDDVRRILSALLDGEALPDAALPPGTGTAALDDHLVGCGGCRAWRDAAQRVTRVVRIQPVDVPDLTATILAAVHADGSLSAPAAAREPGVGRLRVAVRWALGLSAVAQVMLAVPDLLGAAGHEAHAGREVAAFDIALAVGLLLSACYPEHARVFAPVIITLVICFASISALDVLQGAVTPGRVVVHGLALVQAGLVWLLARGAAVTNGRTAGMMTR
jgi:predicted anti-sigma-YlaC factor YlaD